MSVRKGKKTEEKRWKKTHAAESEVGNGAEDEDDLYT